MKDNQLLLYKIAFMLLSSSFVPSPELPIKLSILNMSLGTVWSLSFFNHLPGSLSHHSQLNLISLVSMFSQIDNSIIILV